MEQMCFSGVVDVFVGKSRIVLLQCVLLQFVHEEGVDLRDEGRVVLANVVTKILEGVALTEEFPDIRVRFPGMDFFVEDDDFL